jgi:uncharacterized protein YkwD
MRSCIWVLLFFGCSCGTTQSEILWQSDGRSRSKLPFDALLVSQDSVLLLAERVHVHINATRSRFGFRELSWSPELASVAIAHSMDMADGGYFAHVAPDGSDLSRRFSEGNMDCALRLDSETLLTGGENLAIGHRVATFRVNEDGGRVPTRFRSVEGVAKEIVNHWMESETHRANLLHPLWGREGIGIVVTYDGQILITQNFC